MTLHHTDGSAERLTVRHTLNNEQIAWFKAGAALAVINKQPG